VYEKRNSAQKESAKPKRTSGTKKKEERMDGQGTEKKMRKKPKCFVADNAKVLVWILNYKI
jgi:hypothetical protein